MNLDNIIPAMMFLILGVGFSIITLNHTYKLIPEVKRFKKHSYKIQAIIIGYNSHYYYDDNNAKVTTYSAIYKYNHPNLGPINLTNDVYYSIKPKIGKIKSIYYNPECPYKYHNSILDFCRPLIIFLPCSVSMLYGAIFILFSH